MPPQVFIPFARCLRIADTILVPSADITPLTPFRISVGNGLVVGPRLAAVYQRIERVAASSTTLHLTGESGAGKENAARVFHAASQGARGPFVPVNCATIPEGIAERLLFGARKGAFSGVTADAEGLVQAANGGTLFLDEVAELQPAVQAKLLRVLESREVLALGALRPQPVSIQLCSASHRSLHTEVAAKRLREDLYYRLGRPAERIPSLHERPEEIPWLIDQELRRVSPECQAHVSLIEACLLRRWPGNVRELQVEIRSAIREALGSASPRVRAEHLSPTAGMAIESELAALPTSVAPGPPPGNLQSEGPAGPGASAAAGRQEPVSLSRAQILAGLIEAGGRVAAAARNLGIHRTHLRRLIEHHGVDVDKLRKLEKS